MTDQSAEHRVVQAHQRRLLWEMRAGERLEVTGPERTVSGVIVAIETDSEGDPMVVMVDSAGRQSTITLDYACRTDVELQQQTERAITAARHSARRSVDSGWEL